MKSRPLASSDPPGTLVLVLDAWAETSNVCVTELERVRAEAKRMEGAPCVK